MRRRMWRSCPGHWRGSAPDQERRRAASGRDRVSGGALPRLAMRMGVPFRSDLWEVPYRIAMIRREEAFRQVRHYLTDDVICSLDGGQRRFGYALDSRADKVLGSPKQLLEFLRGLGVEIPATGDDYLAACADPAGAVDSGVPGQ